MLLHGPRLAMEGLDMFRWRNSTIHVLTLLAVGGACSHDWDAYDPRLDGGGAGGHPAGTSTSAGGGGAGGAPAPGTHLGSRRLGGTSYEDVRAVAADNAGNALLTGSFAGNIDFGGGPIVCAGKNDGFIVKLDAACGHVWSRTIGDAQQQA